MDYDQTREVLAAFEREGVDYVVFGGVAMNLQGLPRATEDLDVGRFHLDILTRLGEAFRFEDLKSKRVDFDGLEVSVVTADMLYRMKKDTVRPRDRADADRLRRRLDLEGE